MVNNAEKTNLNISDAHLKIKDRFVWVLAYVLMTFAACTVPALKPVLSYVGLPVILMILFFSDDFKYLAFPVCLFESVWGNLIFGRIGVLTIYMLFAFVRMVLKKESKLKVDYQFTAVLIVVLYCIYSFITEGGNDWIRIACYAFLIWKLYIEEGYSKKKLMYTILAAAIAMAIVLIFGLAGSEKFIENGVVGYRTNGLGYSDPNYSSFVCCLGTCVALCLPKFKYSSLASVGLILLFALAIFTSGSRGSLIILAFILCIKWILVKGVSRKLLYIFAGVVVAIFLITYVLPKAEFFNELMSRLLTLFSSSEAMTNSGRTSIAENYIDYFWKQNIVQMMFGGNVLQSKGFASASGITSAAHNLYLDYLMAFGFVGGVIMLSIHGSRMVNLFKMKDNESQCVFLMKISALVMGFSLSFFVKIIWWCVMFI